MRVNIENCIRQATKVIERAGDEGGYAYMLRDELLNHLKELRDDPSKHAEFFALYRFSDGRDPGVASTGADGLPWTVDDTKTLRRTFTAMGKSFPVSDDVPDSYLLSFVRESMEWILGPKERKTSGVPSTGPVESGPKSLRCPNCKYLGWADPCHPVYGLYACRNCGQFIKAGVGDHIVDANNMVEGSASAPLQRAASGQIREAEIQGAADLAFELAADICSEHCDLDPDDHEKMAHCAWCDQAGKVYQRLKSLLDAQRPAEQREAEQDPPGFSTFWEPYSRWDDEFRFSQADEPEHRKTALAAWQAARSPLTPVLPVPQAPEGGAEC